MTALADALRAQANVLLLLAEQAEQAQPLAPVDELIPWTASGLAAVGLELRAARDLEREGRLAPVKVGRRKFILRSALTGIAAPVAEAVPTTAVARALRRVA